MRNKTEEQEDWEDEVREILKLRGNNKYIPDKAIEYLYEDGVKPDIAARKIDNEYETNNP